MEWSLVIGICLIVFGIFVAGTALGTRGKILPIIAGVVIIIFGASVIMKGEVAFQEVINFINKIKMKI